MASQTMPPRRYVSPVRSAAAAAKRERIVAAAARLLREKVNIAAFTLDAVAKAAGVARLTVYNQFGSRRGLLEAVFDERARQGGLERIAEAMAMPDARAALDRVVEIFCEFWGSDPAIVLLHEATAMDPEFAQAIADRNERRRRLVAALLRRLEPDVEEVPAHRSDAVDLIFGLTSYAMFQMLRPGRSTKAICTLLQAACRAAIELPRGI